MNAPLEPLRVEQYHAMIQAGLLTEDDPVELLDGMVLARMPKNPPHSDAVETLADLLRPLLPGTHRLRQEQPVTLGETSEPEPDLALVRGSRAAFRDRHPGPAEIALLIEVADSTLARDRDVKKSLYAQYRIPCFWIVNLPDRQVEVYTDPDGTDYRTRHDYRDGDAVPVVLDSVTVGTVAVRALLP